MPNIDLESIDNAYIIPFGGSPTIIVDQIKFREHKLTAYQRKMNGTDWVKVEGFDWYDKLGNTEDYIIPGNEVLTIVTYRSDELTFLGIEDGAWVETGCYSHDDSSYAYHGATKIGDNIAAVKTWLDTTSWQSFYSVEYIHTKNGTLDNKFVSGPINMGGGSYTQSNSDFMVAPNGHPGFLLSDIRENQPVLKMDFIIVQPEEQYNIFLPQVFGQQN